MSDQLQMTDGMHIIVEALKHNDLTKLGELMGKSHESMRDDFEITVPQIDYLF